jgi:hypothetical protein
MESGEVGQEQAQRIISRRASSATGRKAEVLRQAFFPPPLQADLSDVEGYEYPPPIECPEITMSEVENAVRRATPNKAPGTDGITNSILHNKKTLDILLPGLCKLFNACLRLGYCPAHFKDTFTVVLRKPGKDDYTQPKAYRPSNQGRMERQNVRVWLRNERL